VAFLVVQSAHELAVEGNSGDRGPLCSLPLARQRHPLRNLERHRHGDGSGVSNDREQILRTQKGLSQLLDRTRDYVNSYEVEPLENSDATNQRIGYARSDLVADLNSRAVMSMECAADHLLAFLDTTKEPATVMAPWTCARGLIESSALVCWLLDHSVGLHERVGRNFAFRYEGFVEQQKLFAATNDKDGLARIQNRIVKVESDALSLGFQKLLNKKGDLKGIGQVMPSITSIIAQTLGMEAEYRLFSGIAHGHHWALLRVGFMVTGIAMSQGQEMNRSEKVVQPEYLMYTSLICSVAFSKALWTLSRQYGWDEESLCQILEETSDEMGLREKHRFWKI
jgi:hypothetical protein